MWKTLLTGTFLALSIYACQEDYREQTEALKRYCDNVNSGAWPAYKPEIACPAR